MPELEREYAFLSYAHENLKQVLKVYEGLKKRKVNVWIDKKNLGTGRWKPQILRAISRSKYFLICLSNASLKKTSGEKPGFQDEELQIAWEYAREQDERGFTIIPVLLQPIIVRILAQIPGIKIARFVLFSLAVIMCSVKY